MDILANLTKCSINVCKNNGQCFMNMSTDTSYPSMICSCGTCFTGQFCELAKWSKNLWQSGISNSNSFKNEPFVETITLFITGLLSVLGTILSLQTFLSSRKIRTTNLGIYLILFSLTGLTISLIRTKFASINLFVKNVPISTNLIQCAVVRLFLNSLVFCFYWFCFFVALERGLIEYGSVSLYDSRRRSFFISTAVYVLVSLSNILPITYGRTVDASKNFCMLNFTPTGYIFYLIFIISIT